MLGIVVVSYKSEDRTFRFVQEELCKVDIPHRTVVVANGACPAEAERLQERLKGQATVLASENDGFARGNNKGAYWLKSHESALSALLFCNDDVSFHSADGVRVLEEKLHSVAGVGAIGPEVVGPDGKRQGPEPYVGLWKGYVWMYLSTPFLPADRKRKIFRLNYAAEAREGFHYRLSGCCLMVDADSFFEAGMFDGNTFLYAEENILSERLAQIGKGMYYCPDVRVLHLHGATVRNHFNARRQAALQMKSLCYYYRRYRGYGPVGTFAARALNGFIHLFG